jgi:hypothetical protein
MTFENRSIMWPTLNQTASSEPRTESGTFEKSKGGSMEPPLDGTKELRIY